MTGWGKVLLGMALGLPMGAYAVGALVSSSADEPPPREPIIIEDAPAPSQGSEPGAMLSPRPSPEPTRTRKPAPSAPPAPPQPEVVVPSYVDRDDDDRDDDDREDDRDDDDDDDEDDD